MGISKFEECQSWNSSCSIENNPNWNRRGQVAHETVQIHDWGWGGGILYLDLKRIHSENGVESEDIVTMPFFFWLLGKLAIRMKHVFIALLNNREKEGHSAFNLY